MTTGNNISFDPLQIHSIDVKDSIYINNIYMHVQKTRSHKK